MRKSTKVLVPGFKGDVTMPSLRKPRARCRVLVVEDEYFKASDLQRALASLDADVIALVGDLDDARAQIASGGFDVGILDIDLRGDKVFDLADELRRQGILFIFATGYGLKQSRRDLLT